MGNAPFRKKSAPPRNVYERVILSSPYSIGDHFCYISENEMRKFREISSETSVSTTLSSGTGILFNILSVPVSVDSVTPSTLVKVGTITKGDVIPEGYTRSYQGYCTRVVMEDGIGIISGTLHEKSIDGVYEYILECGGCKYHIPTPRTSQEKLYTPSPEALKRVKLSSFSSSNVSVTTSGGVPLAGDQVIEVRE